VLRTTDGGSTWRPVAQLLTNEGAVGPNGLEANGMAAGIEFVDPTRGWTWTTGSYSDLLASRDGGSSWEPTWRAPDGGGGAMVAVSMVTSHFGFAVLWDDPSAYKVATTHDGGHEWVELVEWVQ
jgi:photosystem II stability/assembly factor-like uncharacterized protein